MNKGRWPSPGNNSRTKETNKNHTKVSPQVDTVSVVKSEGQEFEMVEHNCLDNLEDMTGSYVSVRLTVGRNAPFGKEKLEASMEICTPCNPTQEGRDTATEYCIQYLNKNLNKVLNSAKKSFLFENPYVTGMATPEE